MSGRDLRGRRWLPPLGVAALVALTMLDVVLVKLAFEHVDGPVPAASDSFSSTRAAPGSPEPTSTRSPSADSAAPGMPGGRLLLALAPDGTMLHAAVGGCRAGTTPQVAVTAPGSRTFRDVPVAEDLGGVLALRAEARDELVVVGADVECEVAEYRGGTGLRTWTAGPAEDEWHIDLDGGSPVVHAPGGPVEVPCAPVALSTLDAVRLLCDDGALVGTSDGGETWAALGRLEDADAVAFEGPGRGVALASRDDCPVTVLATENGGAGWETTGCLDGETGRAVALRAETVAAIVDDTLWRSDDGGRTWEPLG